MSYIPLHPLAFFVHHPLDLIFLSPPTQGGPHLPLPRTTNAVSESPPAPHGLWPAGILVVFLGGFCFVFFPLHHRAVLEPPHLWDGGIETSHLWLAGEKRKRGRREKGGGGGGGEKIQFVLKKLSLIY